ncbi:MAG: hypothetical protein ABID61_00710 [Candidatus Micrarchaeota archaeon]
MNPRTIQHSNYAIVHATKSNGKVSKPVDLLVCTLGDREETLGIFVTRLVAINPRVASSRVRELETEKKCSLIFVTDGQEPTRDERTASFNPTRYVYLVYIPVSTYDASTFQRIREGAPAEHHVEGPHQCSRVHLLFV